MHPNPVCATGDDDHDEHSSELIDTTAAKEPVIAAEILTDSDHLESHEDRDPSTVIVKSVDKGKGVDPREYGGATCNLISNIIPTDTNSTEILDVFELVHRFRPDKGKNVDPRERGNRVAEDKPGPSRIDFHDYTSPYDWENTAIPMRPLQPLEPDVTSHEPPQDPTLSKLRWHPKISPYRLIMLLTPVTFGTAKAIISQNGGVTVPITIEWVSGVVVSLV